MMTKLKIKMFLLAVLCVFSICNVFARNLYLDNKHPKASDANPGTKSKPWKTVTFAGKQLRAGDKLTIMPGTYYGTLRVERSGQTNKRIIIEGSSLGDVIISGAKSIKSWKRTKKDPRVWEAPYSSKVSFWPKKKQYGHFYVSSEPADLTINGMPLFWAYDGEIYPGTWKIDKNKTRIYVRLPDDTNPNKYLMEVVGSDFGVDLPAIRGKHYSYYTIRNLIVRRFGVGLRLYGNHIHVENNIVEWNAYNGVQAGSPSLSMILKNNLIQWNGNRGTNMAPKGKFINNRFLFNNWKLNSPGWDAAGLKGCTFGLEGLIAGNEAAYNGAIGIWTDIYPSNAVFKNNIAHDNANIGFESEISNKSLWSSNLSYRNKVGFMVYSSSANTIKDNILSDNYVGLHYYFKRHRLCHEIKGVESLLKGIEPLKRELLKQKNSRGKKVAYDWLVKLLNKNMEFLKRRLARHERNYGKEGAYDWFQDLLKYDYPCALFRDNLTENNLLLNNGLNFNNAAPKLLPNPKEKGIITNNIFRNNVLVHSKSQKMIAGYASLKQFQDKSKDGKQCLSFAKFNLSELPKWAQKLYAKYAKELNYPRAYQSKSIKEIYNELRVKNGPCRYDSFVTPSGLAAVARICESKKLQEEKFSDPALRAYYINYKNKPTLVLWRKHGRPGDFAPILLKGLSQNTVLENSYGKKLPLQWKGNIVSVNVGTWPLYLVGVKKNNITEVQPFTLQMPKKLEYEKTMNIVIENPIGHGTLYIDKYQGVKNCPDKLIVKANKTVFPLTLSKTAKDSIIEFRIAGYLNGMYAGRIIRLFTGKSGMNKNRVLAAKSFNPILLAGVANCRLDGDIPNESLLQMGVTQSLKNLPKHIKIGNILFEINKGPKACIGFNSTHVKGKPRPELVTIKLGGKKYKYLAFVQVCAYAPSKIGVPLLKYSLNYDDNLVESTYIKSGINIIDWWTAMNIDQKTILNSNSSWKIWSGDCGNGHEVNIYVHIWENPHPDAGIMSLQINAADPDKKSLMGIIAISGLENKKKKK